MSIVETAYQIVNMWQPQLIIIAKTPGSSETYSEPSQTFKMELFAKIIGCIQPLTIFAKRSILGVSQGYEYASNKSKQKPDALSVISQKN